MKAISLGWCAGAAAAMVAAAALALAAEPPRAAGRDDRITVASYYFPNYHPGDPRNERDRGPGWAEWDLVKAARPRFPGHLQPNVPQWGYTDESDPKVMEMKIDAAADHGVDAFIFDWYHFEDGPFLNRCLDRGLLKARNVGRIQFGLMWANHDWIQIFPYRRGAPRTVLYPGKVSPAAFDRICDHVVRDYFLHPSYWKIDGRPYFSFYDLTKLLEDFGTVEETRAALDRFRAKAKAAGLPGLHLNAVVWGQAILPVEKRPADPPKLIRDLGFDSVTSYVWIHHVVLPKMQTDYDFVRDRYLDYWSTAEKTFSVPYFPNVTMGWDSSPRADQRDLYDNSGYPFMHTISGNTPERFRKALELTRQRLLKRTTGPRVFNINCWNEWTEGSYLEPDTRSGMKYLEAVRDVFGVAPRNRKEGTRAPTSRAKTPQGDKPNFSPPLSNMSGPTPRNWTHPRLVAAQGEEGAAKGPNRAGRPNFLVVVADDMGFSDVGCYGGEIATPSLDALAANGVRFTQFYSTARCWPSRTCILTGYYAQQVRMDPPKGRLPAWAGVLPEYLKPAGYRCYTSGKWHLMGAPKPIADGSFDRSYVLHDHNRFFAPKNHELDDRPLPPVADGAGFYVTTGIANRALGFLKEHAEKHAGRPFLLYLAFTSPHFPLHALEKDIARYRDRYTKGWDAVRQERWQRLRDMGIIDCALPPPDRDIIPDWNLPEEELRKQIGPGEAGRAVAWQDLSDQQKRFQAAKMAIHAAMIDRMDQEIGRVLAQLKAMGAYDNTVVLFVSDNGASAEQIIRGDKHDPASPPGSARSYLCLGPGWSTAANTPFRLHKSWVHEGGISSPLIVHWPAGIRARGELRHSPGHFVDLLPTIMELAGAQGPKTRRGVDVPPLPGRSLVPALAEEVTIPREYLYFHHLTNRAIRVGDWKLVSTGANGPWELYNLKADRCETKNLADQHPDKVRRLAEQWQKCEDDFRSQAGPAQ